MNDRIELYYRYYADAAWLTGRLAESEPVLRRGRSILPASDAIALASITYLFRAGRIEESIREAEKFARRRPNLHTAHRFRGVTLSLGGQFGPALSAFQDCLRLSPEDRPCLAGIARVHAKSGNLGEARAILSKLQGMGASPMFGALISMYMDRHSDALGYLEKSLVNRDGALLYLKVEPVWRPLDANPQFQSIVERAMRPFSIPSP